MYKPATSQAPSNGGDSLILYNNTCMVVAGQREYKQHRKDVSLEHLESIGLIIPMLLNIGSKDLKDLTLVCI